MKTKGFNLLSWAALSLVLVLLDQYTKLLAVAHLKGKTPFVILDGVFELLYSENRGAAFGMMQGKQGFFFLIGAVVLAAAIYVMWRISAVALTFQSCKGKSKCRDGAACGIPDFASAPS